MKKLFAALAIGLMLLQPAAAQTVTPAQAQAQVNAAIVPNGIGAITAAILNNVLTSIVSAINYVQGTSLQKSANLSDLADVPTALNNLGITVNGNPLYTCNYTGCKAVKQNARNTSGGIQATDFNGVDPTGATSSDAGMANFFTACVTYALDCFIPSGDYTLGNDLVVDVNLNTARGFYVHGTGGYGSRLNFASGKAFKIVNSSSVAAGGAFYTTFERFGVTGNVSGGAAMQVGNPAFTDAINGFAFRDMRIQNIANNAGSAALELNQVYSSVFDNITTNAGCPDNYGNCPSGGDSLRLRQAAFNHFTGSYSGSRVGIHMTVGYSFGNVFENLDQEVSYYNVVIDTINASNNTFMAGQWQHGNSTGTIGSAVYATGGTNNEFYNLNFSGSPNITNATGIRFHGAYALVLAPTPTFPATNTVVANNTGRDVQVTLYGTLSGTNYCFNGALTCVVAPVGSTTYLLRTGDSTKVTYTGTAPNWIWTEL